MDHVRRDGLSNSSKISGSLAGINVGDAYPIRVMGVINLTKNSFYTGSVRLGLEQITQTALEMQRDGADLIYVGARSTAPYRKYDIPQHVEARLIKEAVGAMQKKLDIPISVDTTRAEPAKAGISEGARVLNDVYGLTQRDGILLARMVANAECSLIVSAHETRQRIGTPIERVRYALQKSVNFAAKCGVQRNKLSIDPGIGFFSDSKISNVDWNCTVLAGLRAFRPLGLPLCVGVSRKKFIGTIGGNLPPEKRISGSLAATAIAVYNGSHIIRTHDVQETAYAVKVADKILSRQKRLIRNLRESEP